MDYLFRSKGIAFATITGLLLLAVGLAFLTTKFGVAVSIVPILISIGSIAAYYLITDLRTGFMILTVYAFFHFYIARLLPFHFPTGTLVDAMLVILFCSIFFKKNMKWDWSIFKNYFFYALAIIVAYDLIQAVNPSSQSIIAWAVSLRRLTSLVLAILICSFIFTDEEIIKKYTFLWLFLSLLAALYGAYQEIFGFTPFEWDLINSNEAFANLIYVWGYFRKFSFMSDVTTFGLLMAYSGMFSLILALGVNSYRKKMALLVSAMIMFAAMGFSGTRTAYAMIPIGFVLFIVMNITNWKALALAVIALMIGLVAYFGPFYGTTMTRIRSAFKASDDPSMNVRDVNRASIQPYILSHPLGGGLNSTARPGKEYQPGHPLAGFPPDSGYLKIALERGWIGLIIWMGFYFIIARAGIINFYNSKDGTMKYIYAGYLIAFFSISIANFTQNSMEQHPINFILAASYIIMIRNREK